MSQNSLRLVHSRAIAVVDRSNDLAAALVFSVTGLIVQLVIVAIGMGNSHF
jgi:hypothetical protein